MPLNDGFAATAVCRFGNSVPSCPAWAGHLRHSGPSHNLLRPAPRNSYLAGPAPYPDPGVDRPAGVLCLPSATPCRYRTSGHETHLALSTSVSWQQKPPKQLTTCHETDVRPTTCVSWPLKGRRRCWQVDVSGRSLEWPVTGDEAAEGRQLVCRS